MSRKKSKAKQKQKQSSDAHLDATGTHETPHDELPAVEANPADRLNPDPFRGKETKLPPSPFWQVGLCILASVGFGVFVMSMSAADSHKCALSIAMVVALKLLLDTLYRAGKLPLPERFTSLPPSLMLIGWFILIVLLFIVVKSLWPQAWDLNLPIGIFSIVALLLYLPVLRQTILSKPN